jgi:hypothetical protein
VIGVRTSRRRTDREERTMTVSQTDVNVIDLTVPNNDFAAGSDIPIEVNAEVGTALFNGGGRYKVRLTLTDITDPKLLHSKVVQGLYGDAAWPTAGRNTFKFTVPGSATTGREGNLAQPQATVVGNIAPPFDSSFAVGTPFLLN